MGLKKNFLITLRLWNGRFVGGHVEAPKHLHQMILMSDGPLHLRPHGGGMPPNVEFMVFPPPHPKKNTTVTEDVVFGPCPGNLRIELYRIHFTLYFYHRNVFTELNDFFSKYCLPEHEKSSQFYLICKQVTLLTLFYQNKNLSGREKTSFTFF